MDDLLQGKLLKNLDDEKKDYGYNTMFFVFDRKIKIKNKKL